MAENLSKTQIDKLGERLKLSQLGESDLVLLSEYRHSFRPAYDHVVGVIRGRLQTPTTGRPAKSTSSIVEKLRRESVRLSQMQDIAGCRIVVADIVQQDRIVSALASVFPSTIPIDRRTKPSHGYRAVHVVPVTSDKPVEIQIRTFLQHLWAEYSEKLASVVDPAIKYGGGPVQLQEVLGGFCEAIARIERLESASTVLPEIGLGDVPAEASASGVSSSQPRENALSDLKKMLVGALSEGIEHFENLRKKSRWYS